MRLIAALCSIKSERQYKGNSELKICIENLGRLGETTDSSFPAVLSASPAITILNHGQGEGQFKLLGVEWGMYFDDSNKYYFVLEGGSCAVQDVFQMLSTLSTVLEEQHGEKPNLRVLGVVSNSVET